MGTKQLLPIPLITNGNMASNITSPTITLEWEDNVGIHVVWTGTPTGTIAVQVSLDPTNLGWVTVPFTGVTQPAGSGGSDFFDLNQTGAAFVQLIYTAGSGSGTMNAKIALKSV